MDGGITDVMLGGTPSSRVDLSAFCVKTQAVFMSSEFILWSKRNQPLTRFIKEEGNIFYIFFVIFFPRLILL